MRFKNVTTQEYERRKGNPKSDLPNKRELIGYMPLEKRIAELKAAGLRTAYHRDRKFYDYLRGEEDGEFIPPLPRHMPADLAEVADLYHEYQARRREIEARLNVTLEERRRAGGKPRPPEGGTPDGGEEKSRVHPGEGGRP